MRSTSRIGADCIARRVPDACPESDLPRAEGGYRQSPESVAFPGWRVEEIHRALTEEPVSEATWRALERVGRAMGPRERTRPEDDPLTRSLSAAARAEGRAEGRTEGWAEAVRAVLHARGIPMAPNFVADPACFPESGSIR